MSLVDTCNNYLGSRRHLTISDYQGFDGVALGGGNVTYFATTKFMPDKYLEGIILLDFGQRPPGPPGIIIGYQTKDLIPPGFTLTFINVGDDITFNIFYETALGEIVIPVMYPTTSEYEPSRWQLYGENRARFVAVYNPEDVLYWVRTPFAGEEPV